MTAHARRGSFDDDQLPRFVYVLRARRGGQPGVAVFTPPGTRQFALLRRYYTAGATPTMSEPRQGGVPVDAEYGGGLIMGWHWDLDERNVGRLLLMLQNVGTDAALRFYDQIIGAYMDSLVPRRAPDGTPLDGLGRAITSSGFYNSFSRVDNAKAKRVARSCLPHLRKQFDMRSLINCGTQGCLFHSGRRLRRKRSHAHMVVKVTAGDFAAEEAAHHVWRLKHGWNSHTGLPRIYQVKRLDRCAKSAGVKNAFVTLREDLHDVPETPEVRVAVKMLEAYEDRLHRAPPGAKAVHDELNKFVAQHTAELRRIYESPVANAVWWNIVHLQHWLSGRGYTMYDARLANLGIRRPGLQGRPFDIVMRDMGRLRLRSNASAASRREMRAASKRVRPLGAV